ncbi:hypothetical protein ACFUT3_33745 [Streptomyces cinereoruber]|uniref:hypothetical protein n=1 Tax=Streptomyces cinereoruber TaxID=67260 RepID=UPI0036385C20
MTDTTRINGVRLDKPGVKWRKSRWEQSPDWIFDAGMNPTEIALWTFINRRAGQDRLVYSGQADLAKGIGCSVSTIGRTIITMREKGVLEYRQVKGTTNRYTLIVPPQFADDLMPSYAQPEATESSIGELTGEIDTSLLTVPGKRGFDVFMKTYENNVTKDDRLPFPKTWEESREMHGAGTVKDLNTLLKYMEKQIKQS